MDDERSGHVDTFTRDNLPPRETWPTFLRDDPGLHYPARLNAATALLDDAVDRGWGDRRCLIAADGSLEWTYAAVLAHANQIAHVLVDDLGIVPGARVLLRGPNHPWLVATWFAVLKAGAVAVVTMPLLRAQELHGMAEVAAVDLALCDVRFLTDLEAAQVPGLRIVPYAGDSPADLTRLAQSKPTTFANCDTAAADICLLAFTSGTTGRPKATMHDHAALLAIADTFSAHVLRPVADDVFLGTPPIAFTFGLGGLVIFPMRVGASTVLVERASPQDLAGLIERWHASVLFTAPTAYKAMLATGHAGALSSLRRAVSAGEHLPVTTWHAVHDETGLALIDGIGSTELLHIFIGSSGDDIRPGSTGRPVPGYRAKILDLDGHEVPDGTPGRLAVQGPTGCRYLNDPRQADYVQDGWNVTGDTFIRDADGYFWYQARSDDMIISGGYNISGTEVEEALTRHPDVLECAVVGLPDERRGSVVAAFVVVREARSAALDTTDDADALVRELQDHVKATIAPYKYPRVIRLIDALPRTSTGKVQRRVLRERPTA